MDSGMAFAAAARALADRLPRKPYAVNMCEDRHAFMLAFAACLLARQTTLLPPSRASEAIDEACSGRDAYRLTDEDVAAAGPASMDGFPAIDSSQVAAIVFTSGSTGRPVGHAKTWGSLVVGARVFGARLGGAAGIVGTIPQQHMFGLEATVMLPWQNGMAVHPGRPLLPADIGAALAAVPGPRWLITTPLQLRACIDARESLPALAGIVSATMPLDARLAKEAERLWSAPVLEFYGSSEAGLVASRRPAGDAAWELLPEVTLAERDGGLWVHGGHIVEPQPVADELERRGERRFILHGRKEGMVKVAGKRTSLDALNAALGRIAGVRDGAFYLRADGKRVGALAVAPGLDARALRAALRRSVDAAFLPRPLHLVDALPRGENGKLSQAALLERVASLEAETA
jgi:acyl-coenzyme A synthetase/AMP-(fatty) acid ligase